MMCWSVDAAICRLAEVSGKGNTSALRLLTGRPVLVSAASASTWLLPALTFVIGIDQSRREGQEDGAFLAQLCRGKCWSGGEGFAEAREIGEVLEHHKMWQHSGIIAWNHFTGDEIWDGTKYKPQRCYLCVGREETTDRNGGASGEEVDEFRETPWHWKTQPSCGAHCHWAGWHSLKTPGGSAQGEAKPNVVHHGGGGSQRWYIKSGVHCCSPKEPKT